MFDESGQTARAPVFAPEHVPASAPGAFVTTGLFGQATQRRTVTLDVARIAEIEEAELAGPHGCDDHP